MSTLLLDLTPSSALTTLQAWVKQRDLPRFRVAQLFRRLWQAPVASWQEATELPRSLREELDRELSLPRLPLETVQQAADGTRKYLWRLSDGEAIESV